MVYGFAVLYFDEGAGGAADVFEVEHTVVELDLSMVAADALVQDKYLVGTVSTNFGAFFLHREERGLRSIRLVDNQFILFLFILILFFIFIHHCLRLHDLFVHGFRLDHVEICQTCNMFVCH